MTLLRYIESLSISAVIDVGANDGRTCRHWLKTFRGAHVHAIEAQETYSEDLTALAAEFDGRMSVWSVAAASMSGEMLFHVHEEHPSSSSLLASTDESHDLMPFTRKARSVVVRADRLDALFVSEQVELGTQVLLKLDVQGAELEALRGCEGFLESVACVLCEVNLAQLYQGQAKFVDLIEFLKRYGLNLAGIAEQFHSPDGKAVYFDAVFLR